MAEQLREPFEKLLDSPHYSVYVLEKWVERSKKFIACQGRYFEKETVTAPPQSSDSVRWIHELFKRPS
jgi:hypothetical protein